MASDPPWRARYRRLQSWYRETVLQVPPGTDRRGIVRGNMLTPDAADQGLNFLDPDIHAVAQRRAAEVQREGGTLEPDRLFRNLLSSMPLCFNLFGALRR